MTATEWSARDVHALDAGVVIGGDGSEIGRVAEVYTDNDTGQPSWVTVKTGWFGTNESFVPLQVASIDGDIIRVPYEKDMIKGAPNNPAGEPLSESAERELYKYYSLTSTGDGVASGGTEVPSQAANVEEGEYLTRSEEQLQVGTERVRTGRARLRKVVVTEQQTVTVPVTREEVRLVREPIGPGTGIDATIGEEAADVVLTEERVVVSKETVPVERVRLGTETITEQREVTETVRKEQIEFDDADRTGHEGSALDADARTRNGEQRR